MFTHLFLCIILFKIFLTFFFSLGGVVEDITNKELCILSFSMKEDSQKNYLSGA